MSEKAGVVAHRNLTGKGHEAAISTHTRGIIDSEVKRLTGQVSTPRIHAQEATISIQS